MYGIWASHDGDSAACIAACVKFVPCCFLVAEAFFFTALSDNFPVNVEIEMKDLSSQPGTFIPFDSVIFCPSFF
jgi:hypothetical protein